VEGPIEDEKNTGRSRHSSLIARRDVAIVLLAIRWSGMRSVTSTVLRPPRQAIGATPERQPEPGRRQVLAHAADNLSVDDVDELLGGRFSQCDRAPGSVSGDAKTVSGPS
jgi:hypothetical protein